MHGSAGIGTGETGTGADFRPRLRRLLCAAIAVGALAAGGALAFHHPLWPGAVLAAFLGWSLVTVWRPDLWLLVVPAGLPLLNLSPWSGWFAFDEFDLLVLGAIAGGHLRLAVRPASSGSADLEPLPAAVTSAAALFVAASVIALWRGLADAGGPAFGMFQSYLDPMNSVRVFKPLLLALLLVPLIRAELSASPERAMRRVGTGMWMGLAVVAVAVLWERVAYPGLTDLARPYRAVALFWEMHIGGAAIDAYLAMATPFAAWALWSARTPWRWSVAAAVALLTTYACLTTYSRGVYLAVAVPLLFLAAAARGRASPLRWRRRAGRVLAAILLVEISTVIAMSSFRTERMALSARDLRGRVAHWTKGVRLLHDPSDLALGIGLGRLPSHLTRFVAGYEFSGTVQFRPATDDPPRVGLAGPATRSRLAGLYSLTQRVPLREGARYRVEFDYRVEAKATLFVRVCELHLLYERACQSQAVSLEPGQSRWQPASLVLAGPALEGGKWFAPRMAVFEIAVSSVATGAEIAGLRLHDDSGENLLRNGDFSNGMTHWFPSAHRYFTPWHIDNLYLELLVERGPLALVGFTVVVAWTLRRTVTGPARAFELAPFLAAAIGGALLIGALSSVLDASRSAFLLFFLVVFATMLGRVRGRGSAP